jgi:endoglucanase
MRGSRLSGFALVAGLVLGCNNYDDATSVPIVPVGPAIGGLHLVGNHLESAQGDTVVLRGVNRSGSEYQCVHGGGVFDGAWGVTAIAAMASWKINAVRIPLNESCWLGINGVGDSDPNGKNYQESIRTFVDLLHQFHIVPILDLHWVGPGTSLADELQPLPDADHAVDFWTSIATAFATDDGVVFELFNEPFPDSNKDSDAAWNCWSDGCAVSLWVGGHSTSATFQAVGMTALVQAIRPIAPHHLILLGGVQYSNALTQWMAHAPADDNLAPAWHVYNFNGCRNGSCWDNVPATIAANRPIVATEIGENDCAGGFIGPLMQWLDDRGMGYLAWSWNSAPSCIPAAPMVNGRPWPMVLDYVSGTPSGAYAQSFRDHLSAMSP